MPERIETVVLGATGYAAGEALRLLADHPRFVAGAALSRSAAGEPVGAVFPHLARALPELRFSAAADYAPEQGSGPVAVIGAAPHGASAAALADIAARIQAAGREAWIVDMSADFRHPDAAVWSALYGAPHAAPELLADFVCALPELSPGTPGSRVAHPGCFTTAVTLGAAPFTAAGLVAPDISVSAVTGSTGSGRSPAAGTHHPHRHGNLWAYKPLRHRHAPEMEMLLGAGAPESPRVHFVPHSGPFARGIHATIFLTLRGPADGDALRELAADFYAGAALVSVVDGLPAVKDVAGTTGCRIGLAVDGDRLVVVSVIDNLLKGAAGGALQWLNRIAGLPDETGLDRPAVPWS